MLAALHVLAALGSEEDTLSALVERYDRYRGSGEINSAVADQKAPTADIVQVFADREDVTIDELDGMTIATPDRWFNLRPSHTEPLLRLNVEARDALTMIAVRDEILDLARDGWRRIRHSASPRTPVPTELMVPVPWWACERPAA